MLKSLISIPKILGFMLVAAPCLGWADDSGADLENKAYWLCKNQKEVRTIRVQITRAGICSTFYSKQGSEKVVGSGKNHESCMTFMTNIRTNLEKSNWACRDISTTRITASTSAE